MPNAPSSNRQHGSVKENRPLAKGALHVAVLEAGTQRAMHGVAVTVVRSGATQSTDIRGLASFRDLAPGRYDVKIALGKLESQYSVDVDTQSEGVTAGRESAVAFWIDRLGKLQVMVIRPDTKQALVGIKLHIAGPQTLDGQTAGSPAQAQFENVKPGEYTVAITSLGVHAELFQVPPDTSVTVPGGDVRHVVLEVGPNAKVRGLK